MPIATCHGEVTNQAKTGGQVSTPTPFSSAKPCTLLVANAATNSA